MTNTPNNQRNLHLTTPADKEMTLWGQEQVTYDEIYG